MRFERFKYIREYLYYVILNIVKDSTCKVMQEKT